MSNPQTVNAGSIVAFDTVDSANRLTSSGNGINLKAGRTYRLEAIVNTANASSPIGYGFFDGKNNVGRTCYSSGGGATSATASFHSGCLEMYTAPADVTMQVKVTDASASQFPPDYNSYFLATEL